MNQDKLQEALNSFLLAILLQEEINRSKKGTKSK
jgi:hypothetical protein